MVGSAHAQNRNYRGSDGTSATLQVNFGTTPHWTSVRGTRVREIRQADRPGYDMFRYGGHYYAYNNNRWYTSNRDRGSYAPIDDRSVPSELSRVPRDHWQNYPSSWVDANGNPRSNGQNQHHSRNGGGHN
jgi:hypothetical protein